MVAFSVEWGGTKAVCVCQSVAIWAAIAARFFAPRCPLCFGNGIGVAAFERRKSCIATMYALLACVAVFFVMSFPFLLAASLSTAKAGVTGAKPVLP